MTVNGGTLQTAKDADGDVTVADAMLIGTNGIVLARRKSTAGLGSGQSFTLGSLTVDGLFSANAQGFNSDDGPGQGNKNMILAM